MPSRPSVDRSDELARRLDGFLALRGLTPDAVLAEVEDALGRPLLVVATGSVIEGLGNSRSDVDLNVVVEHERLAMMPIVSFEHGILVDTTYFSAREVETWTRAIRDRPWPGAGALDRAGWRRRATELLNCTRFAYGLPLRSRDGWERWIEELRKPWLVEQVRQWWRTEAIRCSLGARWLAPAKPLLAAQRSCDAVLAALEARIAAAGQPYFGAKWLPEKVRVLHDDEGERALTTALRVPTRASEVPAYLSACSDLSAELLRADADARPLVAQLWYAPGVQTRRVGRRTLVSRWGLRGVEVDSAPAAEGEPAPIWEAPIDVPLDPGLLELFVEDMTWLSIVAAPE